jgi:two-component system, cell cycle response regulator DivK
MSKKILVIDDEADVRTYLSRLLQKHGYEVVTAENGVRGLEVAQEHKPALILLDLMMPKQSGTDFYRHLAADKNLAETPVIVVSGLAGRHLAVKEPVAVFDKPIEPASFIAAVRKALGE